jgi:hypothetical protein
VHVELREAQHTPLEHVRPEQQSLALAQCVGLFAWRQQVPRAQRRPSSQVLPAQHAIPAGPHGVSVPGTLLSMRSPPSGRPVPPSPWVFPVECAQPAKAARPAARTKTER